MAKGTGRQGFVFPRLQSLALPLALLQIYRAAALQGLKITLPIPFPSQLTPPRSEGLADVTRGIFTLDGGFPPSSGAACPFCKGREAAVSTCQPWDCSSCPSQTLGALGAPPVGQTGHGGTLDMVEHSPIHQTLVF